MKSFLLLIFSFVSIIAFSQKGVKESCSPQTPPEIDGKVTDWQTEWLLDPDGKFIYNICNDANNLYVRIQISDNATQRKIGLFGFTLWLDPSGKKKEKYGLKYPVGAYDQKQSLPEISRDAKKGELEKNLVSDVEVLELIGLAKESIFSSRLGLMNGMQMAIIATDDGAYQYEVKVPFKAFRLKKADIAALGIGFETGRKAPVYNSQSQSSKTKSTPSKNSILTNLNNYYGLATVGTNGNYTDMSVPTRLWISVKLN